MSISDRIMAVIESEGNTGLTIGILVFVCILLGLLIIRKFIYIWQIEAQKRGLFRELINRQEMESSSFKKEREKTLNGDDKDFAR